MSVTRNLSCLKQEILCSWSQELLSYQYRKFVEVIEGCLSHGPLCKQLAVVPGNPRVCSVCGTWKESFGAHS